MVKRTTEEKENITEEDIRAKLKTLSSMLQQEYLENLLKRMNLNPDIKLMISREVVELYVRRGLWSNAAKIMESAAISFHNPNTKRDIYKQAGILYVRACDFLTADDCFKRAIENALDREKPFLKKEIETIYLTEAQNFENIGKRQKTVDIYERIKRTNPDESVKRKINEKLVVLYEKLGKIREHIDLRDSMR